MRQSILTSFARPAAGYILASALVSGLAAAPPQFAHTSPGIRFEDVTDSVRLAFRHIKGGTGRHYYPEQFGGGAAFLDVEGDGRLDLLLVQGGVLPGLSVVTPPRSGLFHANADSTFRDITSQARLDDLGYGFGVAAADFDNDGFTDLFVTTLQGNKLLRNDGRGHFEDRTAAAGVSAPALSTGAAFVDVDNDGWLDLFVARYTDYTFESDLRCIDAASVREPVLVAQLRTAPLPPDPTLKLAYCGPPSVAPSSNRLYRNKGDGTFADISTSSGIAKSLGHGLGVAIADFNEDGWQDIFVASDMTPDRLFINQRGREFTDMALIAGVALGQNGKAYAGMGVDAADYDNDGHVDLFVTNYENEPSSLYRGDGTGHFEDRSVSSGIAALSQRYLKWGARFVDLDRDGLLDLLVVNGHVDDNLKGSPPRLPPWPGPAAASNPAASRLMLPGREGYQQRAQVYRGTPDGRFEEVSATAGQYFAEKRAGRGAAFADYDNDGDWDVAIVNNDETAALLRNDTVARHPWARLELRGHGCNRDAIGSRVTVRSSLGQRTHFVSSGGSYLSESDRRVIIALPAGDQTAVAEVRWPCGATETVRLRANETTFVEESACLLTRGASRTLP